MLALLDSNSSEGDVGMSKEKEDRYQKEEEVSVVTERKEIDRLLRKESNKGRGREDALISLDLRRELFEGALIPEVPPSASRKLRCALGRN